MTDAQQAAPFVIGAVGHMDLLPDTVFELRDHVRLVFRFLKLGPTAHDPQRRQTLLDSIVEAVVSGAGSAEQQAYAETLGRWPGLAHTPIVVLSSLAPGADSLVAEVALENEFRQLGFTVRAPLPFPADLYREATTFCRPDDAAMTATLQARYDGLCREVGIEHTFPVLLGNDRGISPSELRARFIDDLDPDRSRRRYRAAGEYICLYSQLLLAIWDDQYEADPRVGTTAIVEARRGGLRPGRLFDTPTLALADIGPVAHLVTVHPSNPTRRCVTESRLRFLHPHSSAPANVISDGDPGWQRNRLTDLCRVGVNLDAFNATAATPEELLGPSARFAEPGEEAYRAAWDCMAAVANRAAGANAELRSRADRALGQQFVFSLVAAALAHVFAHWHPQHHHGHGADAWIRSGLITLALALAAGALVLFWLRAPRRITERTHDYRALAEGLRVQLAWSLAGLDQSVAANYLLRQRGELDWIRAAIQSVSFPHDRWRSWFWALSPTGRAEQLAWVSRQWVGAQAAYYRRRAHEQHERLHLWHRVGGTLALTSILMLGTLACVAGGLGTLSSFTGPLDVAMLCGGALQAVFLVLQRGLSWHARVVPTIDHSAEVSSPRLRQHVRLLGNFGAHLPIAVILLAITMHGSIWLAAWTNRVPSAFDLAIIVSGIYLVSGAMAVAWAEKNSFSELGYQYNAMAVLFCAAQRRLEHELDRLGSAAEGDSDRVARDIQEIILLVGKEALAENAEWLLLHRARPLEPVVAG